MSNRKTRMVLNPHGTLTSMQHNQVASYSLATMLVCLSLAALGSTVLVPGAVAEQGDLVLTVDEHTVAQVANYNFTFTFETDVSGDIEIELAFPNDVDYDFAQIGTVDTAAVVEIDTGGDAPCVEKNDAAFSQKGGEVEIFAVDVGAITCPSGAEIQVTVEGIKNPEVAGSHEFGLKVLNDGSSVPGPTSVIANFIADEVSHLDVELPEIGDIIAGAEFSLNVSAHDEYGNLNESFQGVISLILLNDGENVTDDLEGNTEDQAVSGSVEFTLLEIKIAGEYVLRADAGDGRTGEIDPFQVFPAAPNQEESTVGSDPPAIPANGEDSSTITVQLRDEFGNELDESGGEVCLFLDDDSDIGGDLLSDAEDNGDCDDGVKAEDLGTGSYIASFASTEVGTADINAELDGDALTDIATVEAEEVVPDPASIVVSAGHDAITADGNTTTTITVSLQDEDMSELPIEGAIVCLSADLGNLSGEQGDCASGEVQADDQGDGIYTVELNSSTVAGTATITAVYDTLSNMTSVEFRPGTPAALAFERIPSTTISTSDPFEVEVTVIDALGNLVDNATTEIELGIDSGPEGAELDGLVTKNAENGTVLFTNLTLGLPGQYTLNATATNITSVASDPIEVSQAIDLAGYNHALQESVRVQRVEGGMEITWDPDTYADIGDAVVGVVIWRINSPAVGLAVVGPGTMEYENATYMDTTGREGSSYILTLCIETGEGCDEDLSDVPGYEGQDDDALLVTAAGPGAVNTRSSLALVAITLIVVVVAAGTVAMFIWANKSANSGRGGKRKYDDYDTLDFGDEHGSPRRGH